MFGLRSEDIDLIKNVLKSYPEIKEAIIFGSRAKGNQQVGSDIDIALLGKGLESLTAEISGQLNDELPLPYSFDVVALNSLKNQDLKDHIQRVGISFYSQ